MPKARIDSYWPGFFGGTRVSFEAEGFSSDYAGDGGKLAKPAVIQRIRVPAGSSVWQSEDEHLTRIVPSEDIAVYGHTVSKGSEICLSRRSMLGGLEHLGWLGFLLGLLLLPFFLLLGKLAPRCVEVKVKGPVQLGGIEASPTVPVEIYPDGEVSLLRRHGEPNPLPSSRYLLGTRRYIGGSSVRFAAGATSTAFELNGQLASRTVLRGVRLPVGTRFQLNYVRDAYNVTTAAPVVVYGHHLPAGTLIEFARNPYWRLPALSLRGCTSDDVFKTLRIVTLAIGGTLLSPVLIPFTSWRYTRWARITVSEPTQIGSLIATPKRPVEISWSGTVRYFQAPDASLPTATVHDDQAGTRREPE